jgi:hypothetical protein
MGANDDFPRPADYIEFETAEQFMPLVQDMAAVAAQSVLAFRARFQTLAHINRYFAERITGEGWPVYRAAVTAGLVGDTETARQLFKRMEVWNAENWEPWVNLKAESARMAALLDDAHQYQTALLNTISTLRGNFGLSADPQCLESTGSKAAM